MSILTFAKFSKNWFLVFQIDPSHVNNVPFFIIFISSTTDTNVTHPFFSLAILKKTNT